MSAENIIENSKGAPGDVPQSQTEESFLFSVISEIIYSPVNLFLVLIISILIYKIIKGRFEVPHSHQKSEPELPKLRRDFTVKELREFDGNQPDGRVLVAVMGNVYDVTKGKRFYGPGGPYAAFGGRDASRCLATFSVTANDKDEYDDLSDLNTMEMDSVKEWEMQFKEKYDLVGKLLKPGEQPTDYFDEDEDTTAENKSVEDIGNSETKTEATSSDENVRKRVIPSNDKEN